MAERAASADIARRARLAFAEYLVDAGPRTLEHLTEAARQLLDRPAERALAQQRTDSVQRLIARGADWIWRQTEALHDAADQPLPSQAGANDHLSAMQDQAPLQLVDEQTVQRNIFAARLAQSIVDEAVWELNDVSARIASLELRDELAETDLFRPQQLARVYLRSLIAAGLGPEVWGGLDQALRSEIALLATEAYHEINRWLIERGVMPQVNLRQLIRRSAESRLALAQPRVCNVQPGSRGFAGVESATGFAPGAPLAGSGDADATLERFGRAIERHVEGFLDTRRNPLPYELDSALLSAQHHFVEQFAAHSPFGGTLGPAEVASALRAEKQSLKQAAGTPAERATIEVVALLFQSILTEERIPAAVRVWFARLQMPTLRVAIGEPDFFSSVEHPARRLIDRMGACVMGFEAAPETAGPALEAEIARVVQVIEAFPETGRKVFQSVLVEFERFLEHYFRDQNETTRRGVSLASQVEQRETLAIQYTIELRKLLDGVPVQEGVRDFLFHIWADVLATASVRHGAHSSQARAIRDAAAELVWIAGAKTTREERALVIPRVGPLLASLRRGMQSGGLTPERQEATLRTLNTALAAGFTARAAIIEPEQFIRMKQRLEALDDVLPDAEADFEIDDSFALDLSGHDSDELEVVAEGGAAASPEALAAAEQMAVGAWYMLEYRDRQEPMQLAWQGLRRQLSLFVSAHGRCVLFQKRRLAAFLQAGLLTPAQDESLTIAATRTVIAKINADPTRLR